MASNQAALTSNDMEAGREEVIAIRPKPNWGKYVFGFAGVLVGIILAGPLVLASRHFLGGTATAPTVETAAAATGVDLQKTRKVQSLLRDFVMDVRETNLTQFAMLYDEDAAMQKKNWDICTIVQQCGGSSRSPLYGLSQGLLTSRARGRLYAALAEILPVQAYRGLLLQQSANILLGEYQQWAMSCPGECVKVDAPNITERNIHTAKKLVGANYTECEARRRMGENTYWHCENPTMLFYSDLNTTTGEYYLGNVFAEKEVHPRNGHFEWVSVYGDLEERSQFGIRYSGHHFDVNFVFHPSGRVETMPAFRGHNPITVVSEAPPRTTNEIYHDEDRFYMWQNMAGVNMFPFDCDAILRYSKILQASAYVPLVDFVSTPQTGNLWFKENKTIADVPHLKLSDLRLSDFETFWNMVKYTAVTDDFDAEVKDEFRRTGRLVWTAKPRHGQSIPFPKCLSCNDLVQGGDAFYYVLADTEQGGEGNKGFLYYFLLNKLFTFVVEDQPSNHLHTMMIPKWYLHGLNGIAIP